MPTIENFSGTLYRLSLPNVSIPGRTIVPGISFRDEPAGIDPTFLPEDWQFGGDEPVECRVARKSALDNVGLVQRIGLHSGGRVYLVGKRWRYHYPADASGTRTRHWNQEYDEGQVPATATELRALDSTGGYLRVNTPEREMWGQLVVVATPGNPRNYVN